MTQRFPIKRLPNGRAMLNVACGVRMHLQWNNIDFGPYALLAPHPRVAALLRRCGLISELRWERLLGVDPAIVRWDMRNSIPYPTSSFDVVYHSHFLEHLSRSHAAGLLKECRRVLRPGGVLRVAVPDLAYLVRQYRETMGNPIEHGQAIEALTDQMVREHATGPNEQKGTAGFIERLIRGTPEKTGERHLWMYDAVSLKKLLADVGFVNCTVQSSVTSLIPGWKEFHLDADANGVPYKPESLYMEAVRPAQD